MYSITLLALYLVMMHQNAVCCLGNVMYCHTRKGKCGVHKATETLSKVASVLSVGVLLSLQVVALASLAATTWVAGVHAVNGLTYLLQRV